MKSVLHKAPFVTATERGEIEFGLRYISGNALPHFTVTASGKPKHGRGGEFGGCNHGLVLRVRPDLAPLVDLHLSDANGAPLYAEKNGWYWMAGALGGHGEEYHGGNSKIQHWLPDGSFDGYREPTQDECLDIFAKHARISPNEARGLLAALIAHQEEGGRIQVVAAFSIWIDAQRPRWKHEAEQAIEQFKLGKWDL